jgi:hypothetical protein
VVWQSEVFAGLEPSLLLCITKHRVAGLSLWEANPDLNNHLVVPFPSINRLVKSLLNYNENHPAEKAPRVSGRAVLHHKKCAQTEPVGRLVQ